MENSPDIKDKTQTQDVSQLPKTTGEKWFYRIKFATGEGFILVLTAVLAYLARYGKDSYGSIPNYLKKFQNGLYNTLVNNTRYPVPGRLAVAIASTTVLMHGGNLFTPVMKWMEDRKESIVTTINKRWGKPGEVEVAHTRLKDEPKQNWGDVIKGRLVAWLVVFASFVGVDAIAGQDKKTLGSDGKPMYRFDKFEEGFGRLIARIKTPVGEKLTPTQANNKIYLLSKIVALDIYATTATLFIWAAVSKFSAMLRGKKHSRLPTENEDPTLNIAQIIASGKEDVSLDAKESAQHTASANASLAKKNILAKGTADFRSRLSDKNTPAPATAL